MKSLTAFSEAPGRLRAGLALLTVLLCASCDRDQGTHVNDRPFVQIMTRPQGERVPYAVDIYWTGWDRDGVIDHYQYTLDVPPGVTLDQLNDPHFTGVTWTDTEAPGALFLFSTSRPDSLVEDGTLKFSGLYVGRHNLFVRAVDNEGGVSRVDYIEFTAENVAPKTRITLTAVDCTLDFSRPVPVGRLLTVHLGGIDPDRPGPHQTPAFYEWKLIPWAVLSEFPIDVNVIVNERSNDIPWNRVPADSPTVEVPVPASSEYVLAVRSIDVQDGAERWFEYGRNAAYLVARTPWECLTLWVHEPVLGTLTFPVPTGQLQVPVGYELRFNLVGESTCGGAVITGYCVQVDPPDSADCQWTIQPHAEMTFSTPGFHVLSFWTRDCLGHVIGGSLTLQVISFPMDREVLYVDDFRKFKDGVLFDGQMDAMAVDMLRSIGISESDIFGVDTFGQNDVDQSPTPLTLSDLARYRHVVWSVYGPGYNGNPALAYAATCENGRALQAYVASGGSVLVYGQKMMGAFKRYGPPGSACRSTVGYSESVGLTVYEGTFPCDFAGLCSLDFRDVAEKPLNNGLIRARPRAGVASADVPFPPVEVDSTLFPAVMQIGGIPFVDANFQPTFTTGLDTLYVVEQTPKTSSAFRYKPIAWRYADPDPVPSQGPVALFGFPFHLLKQGEVTQGEDGKYRGTGVKGLVAATFDWFRQNGDVARAAPAR